MILFNKMRDINETIVFLLNFTLWSLDLLKNFLQL